MTALAVYRAAARKARRMKKGSKWWRPIVTLPRVLAERFSQEELQELVTVARNDCKSRRSLNTPENIGRHVDAAHVVLLVKRALKRPRSRRRA